MKILMLSSTFPYPPSLGGTPVRTFNLLKYLTQNHEITLITQKGLDVSASQIEELQQWVKELKIFPRRDSVEKNLNSKIKRLIQFWREGTPPNVLFIYNPEIQQWLDLAVAQKSYDVITCEHSVNQIYVRPEWKQALKTVVNIHSSVYKTCLNQLETNTAENPLRDRFYLPLLKRYEQKFCQKFSNLVVTTEEDRTQIQLFNPPGEITIIPNGVDLELFPYRQVDPGGHQLIIAGLMDYVVNIDMARFFSLEILPILQEKYPDTTLVILGSKPSPAVLELAQRPGITVTGRVPSMAEYLHQATVCVVPMRSGFGIKNKTLEAMAAGVPVVASDRGLEGLKVDSSDVPIRALRANRIEEYVTQISRLFEDAQLRAELSRNGRDLIEQEYTWEQSGKRYEEVLSKR
ncbi:glycosyltransferase family 4 protein [Gloeothece verrucosa]|uniref:Glycosyl transferase group 1 n=1 Tax=Gloeothece verrucosa (strain PCC 7822) TaxID=497965 RepID=E0UIT4_GLOV7|nr:glycosyltransferase family 4 protein [Gloeothece verrucosa]ADN13393.1 glycosyl transferase group 1 [Gloeothece verrucosa PCC 7822]